MKPGRATAGAPRRTRHTTKTKQKPTGKLAGKDVKQLQNQWNKGQQAFNKGDKTQSHRIAYETIEQAIDNLTGKEFSNFIHKNEISETGGFLMRQHKIVQDTGKSVTKPPLGERLCEKFEVRNVNEFFTQQAAQREEVSVAKIVREDLQNDWTANKEAWQRGEKNTNRQAHTLLTKAIDNLDKKDLHVFLTENDISETSGWFVNRKTKKTTNLGQRLCDQFGVQSIKDFYERNQAPTEAKVKTARTVPPQTKSELEHQLTAINKKLSEAAQRLQTNLPNSNKPRSRWSGAQLIRDYLQNRQEALGEKREIMLKLKQDASSINTEIKEVKGHISMLDNVIKSGDPSNGMLPLDETTQNKLLDYYSPKAATKKEMEAAISTLRGQNPVYGPYRNLGLKTGKPQSTDFHSVLSNPHDYYDQDVEDALKAYTEMKEAIAVLDDSPLFDKDRASEVTGMYKNFKNQIERLDNEYADSPLVKRFRNPKGTSTEVHISAILRNNDETEADHFSLLENSWKKNAQKGDSAENNGILIDIIKGNNNPQRVYNFFEKQKLNPSGGWFIDYENGIERELAELLKKHFDVQSVQEFFDKKGEVLRNT